MCSSHMKLSNATRERCTSQCDAQKRGRTVTCHVVYGEVEHMEKKVGWIRERERMHRWNWCLFQLTQPPAWSEQDQPYQKLYNGVPPRCNQLHDPSGHPDLSSSFPT